LFYHKKWTSYAKKKLIDFESKSVFTASCEAYSAVLNRMRERMLLSGYAKGTIISYIRAVRDLMESVKKTPDQCSEEEVIRHLNDYRARKQLSPSTLNTRIFGILYVYREVYKDKKLGLDIPNPGRSKSIGEILTVGELEVLLAACHYPRQSAVLHLLYDTGLRASEVANLRLGDFDKRNGVLYVRYGKGGKHRVVPYGQAVVGVLKVYFELERPTDYLFEGNVTGCPISVSAVQYMVREAHQRTAIRKAVHPHILRHTFAVHYINNGGSLVRLQQLLGHSHLSTTLLYLRYAAIPLRDIDTPLDVLRGMSRNRK
jgi:site-specific recombinase XerD